MISVKHIGGLTFWRVGRFGGSVYVTGRRRHYVLARLVSLAVGIALAGVAQ